MLTPKFFAAAGRLLLLLPAIAASGQEPAPDAIYRGGQVVTADAGFSLQEAFAVHDGRIVAVGPNATITALAREGVTRIHELHGRMVLPGLIDSHVHAPAASMHEVDHEIPTMETIPEVLDYIRARAKVVPAGEWIQLQQVFITRLREARFPTRAELDAAAPNHPVVFRTGPDLMLNTRGMRESGFNREFKVTDGGPGHMELDASGNPTGLMRGLTRFLKTSLNRSASDQLRNDRLRQLLRAYNEVGLTAIGDRGANPSTIAQYTTLRERGDLSVRVSLSQTFPTVGAMDSILAAIDQIGASPLRREDPWLRLIGTKIWLDGGMLTGSAYMLKPWGRSEMYGITDDDYRGVLNVPPERLYPMVERVAKHGMQFTAHAVGDGAITELVRAYTRLAREHGPIRDLRMGISHSNFMTLETVEQAAQLGVVLDIQPPWLYLDTRTLVKQFGYDRLRYFQPLRTAFTLGAVAGGGSDHMLKIGDTRAINPYNPFLGMWTTITRRAKWYEGQLHPEEALTREQAIRFYTINNAHLLFREKEIGSIEPGKRADFVIIDRDLLRCPVDDIKETQVLQTWVDGRRVFERPGLAAQRLE